MLSLISNVRVKTLALHQSRQVYHLIILHKIEVFSFTTGALIHGAGKSLAVVELASPCDPGRRGSRRSRRRPTRTDAPASSKASDRRRSTGRPRRPASNSRRWVRLILPLRLDKHRNRLACREAESPVPKHGQDGRDLARVTRDGQPGRVVLAEDLVEHDLCAGRLAGGVLARDAVPVGVLLREAWLELPRGEEAGDVRAVGATVACVDANTLAEELLYSWRERSIHGEIKAAKCDIRGIETPSQW